MKYKRIVMVLAMVLSVAFIFAACGTTEIQKDDMQESVVPEKSMEPEAVPEPTEDPENPEPKVFGMKIENPLEFFRFETTALIGEGGDTINPTGMLLNIGCEDCQDIFYASKTLTINQIAEKLRTDFGIEEMLHEENFVRFDLDLDLVRKLEIELDLIAAKKLTSDNEIVNIRIITLVPVE